MLYTMKYDYRFTFGKYRGERVEDVLMNGWYGKTYIVWAYYNKEEISFSDDILNSLNVTEFISKPGIDPDKYYIWLETIPPEAKEMIDRYQKNLGLGILSHKRSMTRKYYSNRLKKHEEAMEKASSKARLQWKNQGH